MILHADMDAFYASVEIRENPALRDLPVAVGGAAARRGVIAAASYKARTFGVRSAIPTATAQRLCPELVLLPPNMALYVKVSHQIHEIFARYTPLIEPLSLDEAFLDVSASQQLFGSTYDIALRIKQEIRDELGLIVSIGVAPNKFIAKIASDLDKPDGLVVVTETEVQNFLDPLPISRLWGVGKVMEQHLKKLGIYTIQDLRSYPLVALQRRFGQHGEHLYQLAQGIDHRRVETEQAAKSISHETTFGDDITDPETLRAVLLELTEQVATRLRRKDLAGKTVHLKLRYDNFHTITRAHSLTTPTHTTRELWQTVNQLFEHERRQGLPPIRLIGMGVSGFGQESQSDQLSLFDAAPTNKPQGGAQTARIDQLTDTINSRFGGLTLHRARGFRKDK